METTKETRIFLLILHTIKNFNLNFTQMEGKVMKNASSRNKNLTYLLRFCNIYSLYVIKMADIVRYLPFLLLTICKFIISKLLLTSKVPSYRWIHRHDSQISAESCDSRKLYRRHIRGCLARTTTSLEFKSIVTALLVFCHQFFSLMSLRSIPNSRSISRHEPEGLSCYTDLLPSCHD